jgi:hypothetical protein
MYSIRKIISFLPLVFILLLLLLNSCSDRSEYGTESDYEKLGAVATETETGTGTGSATETGSGTIKGSVISYSGSNALSGVSVSYALSGTTVGNAASTDSSGDFKKSSLETGTYTLSYSKDGYVDETQSSTLATENQTLTVGKLKMLSNNCSSTSTISGKIIDAVSGANVQDVIVSIRRGANTTSGNVVKSDNTSNAGAYSISSVAKGWYTAKTEKNGYSESTFNVVSCDNVTNQDSSISTTLSSTAMRIILSWPTGSTAADLDSHISIPDNSSNPFHLNYLDNTGGIGIGGDYYDYGVGDNTTLDRDDSNGAPGTETITITHVKSGNYSYSVHDFTNGYTKDNASSTKLANSGASVTVYYKNKPTTYNPPNSAGTHWTVFTFTTGGGLVEVGSMKHTRLPNDVY